MTLIVFGDSHANALASGYALLDEAWRIRLEQHYGPAHIGGLMPAWCTLGRFFRLSEDGIHLTGEKVGGRFAALTEGDDVIRRNDPRTFGISLGLHCTRLARDPAWQSFGILRGAGRQFVSEAVFRAIVLDENQHVLALADALGAAGVACFFLGAPFIKRGFVERFAANMPLEGFVLLQRRYNAIMAEAIRGRGIPVFLPPGQASEDGILKPEFDVDDPSDQHHANAAYGRLVWAQIAEACEADQRPCANPAKEVASVA